MKNRLKSILIIFSFLALQVGAQEKKTLKLDEAISLSLQNSKQLKNSEAKIEEATAALKESVEKKSNFPPTHLPEMQVLEKPMFSVQCSSNEIILLQYERFLLS